MSFIILTDSTTDLPKSFYEATGVVHEPHGFIIDGVDYRDRFWEEMSQAEYYGHLKAGKPMSTTHPSLEKLYADVEQAFANGEDALYICFSSKLSGTYNTTRMVAAEMEGKYPGRCLYTVDTACASMGQSILVMLAADMQKNGANLDTVVAKLEAEKDKIYHLFTVDDLHHLKRGGRLSATSAVMGTLIGIKPILHMSDEGLLVPIAKIRGRQHALEELVRMALEKIDGSSTVIYIPNVGCTEEAEKVANMLREKVSAPVEVYSLGPAISTHTGIGTIGIVFHSEQ